MISFNEKLLHFIGRQAKHSIAVYHETRCFNIVAENPLLKLRVHCEGLEIIKHLFPDAMLPLSKKSRNNGHTRLNSILFTFHSVVMNLDKVICCMFSFWALTLHKTLYIFGTAELTNKSLLVT